MNSIARVLSSDYSPSCNTTAVEKCKYGHCFHDTTAIGFYRCCRCGEIKNTTSDKNWIIKYIGVG